jgi:phosphoribosylanthranilate isomerase
MSLVKICGIRHQEAAEAAASNGASLIGFVFVPVRRQVAPEAARSIINQIRYDNERPPAAIGLFVNEEPETINQTVELAGLDLVQLHGDEPPEMAREIDVPVIKALRLGDSVDRKGLMRTIESFLEHCAGILIDSHVPGQWGGTGVVGDWELAADLASQYPVILAGGLNPANVGAAIEAVRPAIVDVSSGVETDGTKDSNKIAAFLSRAAAYSDESSTHHAGQPLIELIDRIRDRHAERTSGIVPGVI